MSSVTRVPQTRTMVFSDTTVDDAHEVLRHYGRLHLVKSAFVRFRYGDGFSHSRALALQLVLSLIPLGIAFVGLSSTINAERPARVLREVLLRITPGSTDEIVRKTLDQGQHAGGQRRPARALARPGRLAGRADDVDGPDRAGRQPHLRHPAGPPGAAASTAAPC